jgi:hypothetical protein
MKDMGKVDVVVLECHLGQQKKRFSLNKKGIARTFLFSSVGSCFEGHTWLRWLGQLGRFFFSFLLGFYLIFPFKPILSWHFFLYIIREGQPVNK